MLKFFTIAFHIAVLYGIFLAGMWIQQLFNLFIPGSVIGLVLLFLLLISGVLKVQWIEAGTTFIIKHLAFFFIPVTAGVMNYFDLFAGKGIVLVLIGLFSTVLVIVTGGHVSQALMRRRGAEHE